MVRVKICGNKRKMDALKAAELGADGIGLLVGQLHTSDDFIEAREAREIVAALPPLCSSVLVTDLAGPEDVIKLARATIVTTIQLHGDTTPDDVVIIRQQLPHVKLIKAVHVADEHSISAAMLWEGVVDVILLDSSDLASNRKGGTGKVHDWEISARIVQQLRTPVILAGGLTPENVQEAISTVKPYGVDVNSGTKGSNGFKDHEKLRDFIARAKSNFS